MAIVQARGIPPTLTPPGDNGGSSTATTSTKAAATTTSTPPSTPTSHSSSHSPSQAPSTPPSSTKESTPTSKSEAHSSSSKTTQASSTSSAPTSTAVTSSSSSSSTSSSSTATVFLSGTQSVPASFTPATTVVSGTNTFVYAAPTDDGSDASGLASAAKVTNHNSFFANKGAVAGTFTVVALIALGIFVWLFTWGQRKRRQSARRKDRYLKSGWVSDKESGHRKSGEGEDQHDDGYDFDSSRYNRNHDEHEEEVHEVTGEEGSGAVQMSTFNSPSMVAFSNNMDNHGTYVEPAREEATSPQIHHQYSHSVTHDYLGQGTPGGDYNNNTSQYRMSGLEFPPEMAQQQQAQSNNGQYQQQYQQQQSYNVYDAGAQQQPAGRQYKSSPLANAYAGEHEHHAIGDDEDAAAHAV